VDGAVAEGIGLIAIADHDTVQSVLPAAALARDAGLSFLRAAEVSSQLDGRLFHVLAYGIDVSDVPLLEMMEHNRQELRRSNSSIMRGLVDAGFGIDWEDYLNYENDPRRGGFLELNFLIDHGLCKDVRDFFETVLPEVEYEGPHYVPLAEAVTIIRAAGGAPVIAHPGASMRDIGVRPETLDPLVAAGVAGFECYSQYHDATLTNLCVDYCHQRDHMITGGSDFHGGFVGRRLGVPVVTLDELVLRELVSEAS